MVLTRHPSSGPLSVFLNYLVKICLYFFFQGDIDKVEQNVIDALVPFVLKLSESLFKPLYYQIFHWASEHKDRAITFFR